MSSISKKSDPGLPVLCGNDRLRKEIAAGGIAQPVILAGPDGSGRHTAARLLAAAAVCASAGQKPCGVCSHCRKAAEDEHPDVLFCRREGKVNFPVEQVRRLRQDAFLRPTEAERKVYIVEDAQTMNAFGQNALLKVLEEPPAFVRFVLLVHHPEELLETVRSRCRLVQMEPLSPEDGEALLARMCPAASPEDRARALTAAGGFAGAAARYLIDDREKETAAALDFLSALAGRDEQKMLEAAMALEKAGREEYSAFLDVLAETLAAAIERHMGVGSDGVAEEAARLAETCSLRTLLSLRERTERSRDRVRFNVRPQPAAVGLCAEMAEILSL